jgi:alpha-mannosidase
VYQGTNDIGRHRFTYSMAGHKSDWRAGSIPSRAARLNQPLEVFQTAAHAGRLGRSFSMLRLSSDGENQVAVRAFKKAEDSEEIVLRLQELYGRPARGVEVALAEEIAAVREVNAAEEETPAAGRFRLGGGRLTFDLGAYQPRTFALKMRAAARETDGAPQSIAVELPFDLDGISTNANRRDGDFDGKGRSLASELLPQAVTIDGIHFKTGDRADGARNVIVSQGQEIKLPEGAYNRLYVLAAAVGGDTEGSFTITTRDGKTLDTVLGVKDWSGVTGQWDSRLVDDRIAREVFTPPEVVAGGKWSDETVFSQLMMRLTVDNQIEGLANLRPAFIKRDEVGWVGTHRHAPAGDEPYIFCNLFKYRLDLPQGATTLTLPKNSRIRIVAVTAAKNTNDDTSPASHLYVD